MAPTSDEELKLRLFTGEITQLGPADRFLKVLVDVPFSFKRIEALLFMCSLEEDVALTKESFQTLEVSFFIMAIHHLLHFLNVQLFASFIFLYQSLLECYYELIIWREKPRWILFYNEL